MEKCSPDIVDVPYVMPYSTFKRVDALSLLIVPELDKRIIASSNEQRQGRMKGQGSDGTLMFLSGLLLT